jgi:two-component system, NtrC family, sensor kinase
MQFLKYLNFSDGFMTHVSCYLWTPSLIGLNLVSDSLIALSCLSIAIAMVRGLAQKSLHRAENSA